MNAHAANSELRGHLVEGADIQRLLCVESHIKVNLAPSALVPRSTNLLSVWWGSWTSSPFQHTGTNPQDLSRFFHFPVTWAHNKGHRGHFEISCDQYQWSLCTGPRAQYMPLRVQFGPLCLCLAAYWLCFHIAEINKTTIKTTTKKPAVSDAITVQVRTCFPAM